MAINTAALRQRPGIIRVATLLLSLLGLIFLIVDMTLQNSDEMVGFEASIYAYISLTSFAWTILWSISAVCVLLFHGPYPADVDVGLDFIGWGLAWGFGVTLIMWAAEMDYPEWSCDLEYNSPGYCTQTRVLMASEVLAGVFALLYGTCHLLLSISAIKTLFARRRSQRNKSIESELQDGEHLTAEA